MSSRPSVVSATQRETAYPCFGPQVRALRTMTSRVPRISSTRSMLAPIRRLGQWCASTPKNARGGRRRARRYPSGMADVTREIEGDEVERVVPLLLLAEPSERALRWSIDNLSDAV